MSLNKVSYSMIDGAYVNVLDYGAVGDGITNDTAAIQAAINASTNRILYFPALQYKVTGTLTVTCNTEMEEGGYIAPSAMPSNAIVFSVTERTQHKNIRVVGDAAVDPANGTVGISPSAINANRSSFYRCSAINLKYGFLIKTFSVLLLDCRANFNTTNLSAYAPSSSQEINDLHIIAGNYSDPIGTYSMILGDSSFATTVTPSNQHGAAISVRDCALDLGSLKLWSVTNVVLNNVYFENPSSGTCIELAENLGQDGYVNNVLVQNCYFRTADYAIYCHAGVRALVVTPCTYSAILKCALYVNTDIYPYSYTSGYSAGSFSEAPEVHTGRRHAVFTTYDFANTTLPLDGLFNGVQSTIGEPTQQYANARWSSANTIRLSSTTQYGTGRRYKTPATSKAGSFNSYFFTLTTASDARFFNGGDEYDAGAFGGGVIDNVDYETGVLGLSDAFAASPTAGSVSQNTSAWLSSTVTTNGSPPASGTWAVGDTCLNGNPVVGQPKGWQCTVAGTPGTWVSEGIL